MSQQGGKQQLTSNIVDISLVLMGALLLPIYFFIFRFDENIFNMLQRTHVVVLSLYALIYINFIKKECFNTNELRYRAFNLVFTYSMFIFFLMFLMYIVRIFLGNGR